MHKNRIGKRITMEAAMTLMSILLVISACGAEGVYAEDNEALLRSDQQCKILVETHEKKLTGKKMAAYQVAALDESSEQLDFIMIEEFEKTSVDIHNLDSKRMDQITEQLSKATAKADGTAAAKPVDVITLTQEGSGVFNVPAGVYLICMQDEGEYAVQKSLVSVPQTSETGSEWIYEITIEPKVGHKPKETVKTGDKGQASLWLGLAGGAGLMLAALCGTMERKRKEQKHIENVR